MPINYNNDNRYKKGALLAEGKGINDMMHTSYVNNYTDKNTILEVKNPSSLESRWKIYDKIRNK